MHCPLVPLHERTNNARDFLPSHLLDFKNMRYFPFVLRDSIVSYLFSVKDDRARFMLTSIRGFMGRCEFKEFISVWILL